MKIDMENINKIYEMLHWKNDVEVQTQGIEWAKKLEDISMLIQPPADISIWGSCAKVLYEKSDDVLEPYLIKLIEWLQDFNWPGALTILDRLKKFSGKKLETPFIEIVKNAIVLNNEEGFMLLDNLSQLLENDELKVKLPGEILEILQKHYEDTGWWYEE